MKIKKQASALPYRIDADGKIEVLLITSKKRSGKWLIPKGHVEPQEELVDAAAREALEEAGVKGEISPDCIGSYIYEKHSQKYDVSVYPLEVKEQLDDWEDHKTRNRQWYRQKEAARLVKNIDVGKIITTL